MMAFLLGLTDASHKLSVHQLPAITCITHPPHFNHLPHAVDSSTTGS